MSEATRVDRLVALRAMQEGAMASGEIPVRDFSALSREYRATLAEIADLTPKTNEGDAVDEIAARRATRRSGAASGSTRAKRSS